MPALVHPRPYALIEIALVAAVLLTVFSYDLLSLPNHPDESSWVAETNHFEVFISGDFDNPIWDKYHQTLTQPPMARYTIALGRLAGGFPPEDLTPPWDFSIDRQANIAAGNIPHPELLWWCRLPMALLFLLSSLILFLLIKAAFGRPAGYTFLFLFAGNPYFLSCLRLALSESTLFFFLCLSALSAWWALRAWQQAVNTANPPFKSLYPTLAWFAASGVFCGMAGAAKLNGLAALGALCGLVLLVTAFHSGALTWAHRWRFALAGCFALVSAVGTSFIGVNPFLYPNPINRALEMLDYRLWEMEGQVKDFPANHIDSLAERLTVVPQRIFADYSFFSFDGSFWLNLVLFLVGLVLVGQVAYRWLRTSKGSAAGLVLLLMAVFLATPPLLTPLDWTRYYLLPIAFSTICVAVALGRGLELLYQQVILPQTLPVRRNSTPVVGQVR